MKLLPVKDNPGLAMDIQTGAVINRDSNAIDNARTRKQKRLEEKKKRQDLESEVQELKALVKQLIEDQND